MSTVNVKLENICSVKMGYPIGRAKAAKGSELLKLTKVLMPSAMSGSQILMDNLAREPLAHIKDSFYSRESDVILKMSAPYDCVYISGEYEGILVTSFAAIIRPQDTAAIDMRYLAAFFNTSQARMVFQDMGTGTVMPMLKKGLLEDMPIPLPPLEEQRYLAKLFDNMQKRKMEYRKVAELSDLLLESEFVRRVF